MGVYDFMRFYVAPATFPVIFTAAVQFLTHIGGYRDGSFNYAVIYGNKFSWIFVAVVFIWAYVFLIMPSEVYFGPSTPEGYTPYYVKNGILYYTTSTLVVLTLFVIYPNLPSQIYRNIPQILGSLNIVAFVLCFYLLIKSRHSPEYKEHKGNYNLLYDFYRGGELHPRILGVDVKQLTNCRVGMMLWQFLILTYYFAASNKYGSVPGHMASVGLQSIYICKFFYWEDGYFNTLDITMDRAGYYICWGCIVWVPGFYAYSSYFFVTHPPHTGRPMAIFIFLVGVSFIALNYRADYEKQLFRDQEGYCWLWGKKADFIQVEYQVGQATKKSKLLTSGCWGVARHLNYDFELLAALSWNIVGLRYGLLPFLYNIFLCVLLVHRVFRDEEKCAHKYGQYWDKYCNIVRYRMIPGVF